jgi:hypothetical protein
MNDAFYHHQTEKTLRTGNDNRRLKKEIQEIGKKPPGSGSHRVSRQRRIFFRRFIRVVITLPAASNSVGIDL